MTGGQGYPAEVGVPQAGGVVLDGADIDRPILPSRRGRL
jgi:hypothetical protein